MHNPLTEACKIRATPKAYLKAVGEIFAVFGPETQDSGNVSYGVEIADGRNFV